jgi:hypothetical protein
VHAPACPNSYPRGATETHGSRLPRSGIALSDADGALEAGGAAPDPRGVCCPRTPGADRTRWASTFPLGLNPGEFSLQIGYVSRQLVDPLRYRVAA